MLDNALYIGIKEADFWFMSVGEINREIDVYNQKEKLRLQEQATFNYKLADLIGRSISRLYSASARMPDIAEVYPTLFDSEEIKEQRRAKENELSAIRFKMFADSYNKRLKESGK